MGRVGYYIAGAIKYGAVIPAIYYAGNEGFDSAFPFVMIAFFSSVVQDFIIGAESGEIKSDVNDLERRVKELEGIKLEQSENL